MKTGKLWLVATVVATCIFGAVCCIHSEKTVRAETVPTLSITEFVTVHDSLYDCAMNICMGLAECDGSCFYTDVDAELIEAFRTYRVPNLEVLLNILDQIDAHGSVYDVYDDDEGTVFNYYTLRERYKSFF